MRSFANFAVLIRSKRLAHPDGLSQTNLSTLLGYKNGQFISNVERGMCNIPLRIMKKISVILDINSEELKVAILKDQEITLDNYFNSPAGLVSKKQKKTLNKEVVF